MLEILQIIGLVGGLVAAMIFLPLAGKAAAWKFLPNSKIKDALLKEPAEPERTPASEKSEWRGIALFLAFMLGLFGLAFLDDSLRRNSDLTVPLVVAFAIGLAWLARASFAWFHASSETLSPRDLESFQKKIHGSWLFHSRCASLRRCLCRGVKRAVLVGISFLRALGCGACP